MRRSLARLAPLAERLGLAADAVIGLPPPYPGPYMDSWLSLIRARALITAARLGLFEALPGSTAELAARTGTQPDRLGTLLVALEALRYVKARRGTWRATRRTRSAFGAAASLPLHHTVASLAATNWEVMSGLDDVIRGGAPPGLHDGSPSEATWAGYQAAMVELNALVSGPVLAALGAPRRLLDIGGGPATFAIAAARRWPQLTVAIADLPQAAALARERIAAAGLGDRISYIAGDARQADLGEGYDTVTMLQLLHNVDRPAGVELLRAAGRAAGGGGRVTVLEIEGAGTQVGALASLAFTGWMGSRAWTGEELAAMAREAGLTGVRVTRPPRLLGSVLVHASGF